MYFLKNIKELPELKKIIKNQQLSRGPNHSQFDEVSLSEVRFYSICFYTSSILESGNDSVYSISA